MPNDITKANSSNDIKNGTLIVSTKVTGLTAKDVSNVYTKNTPTIESIQAKYTNRFDDPSYYHGNATQGS
jgi:hypothetical protein